MNGKKQEDEMSDDIIESNTSSINNSMGRSRRWSFQAAALSRGDEKEEEEEEEEELQLQWAAIERLPTYNRLRTSLFFQHQHVVEEEEEEGEGEGEGEKQGRVPVDVGQLGPVESHLFIENMIKHIQKDNLSLLQKQRRRIDRVNVKQPTIEVRYQNLCVEAECQVVQGKPLPTLWNSLMSTISGVARLPGLNRQQATIRILKDINGVIKMARLTLLLGPPGCGKSTFLRALSGMLDKSLKVNGEISYNGYRLDEFVPEKTSAYVSQHDLHIPEMTVREILDFSARFQGVGSRAEIMKEVIRREKEQGITPDPDVDAYMKAISLEGLERSLQTDYIMKIMGLDICADTIVGDAMRRGISGGEKKRLTTGEMIIGPSKALFMDEISTGLDSSTTFQIVSCLQQLAHIAESTVVVSLLQPAPETYNLFDDVILMAEGKIVYHGPRDEILNFFEECGFKCPERKGAADFLQEVLSKKDQEQYWSRSNEAYRYVTVDELIEIFRSHKVGQDLSVNLAKLYDKSQCHKNALSFSIYSLSKWELFKACVARELLLMRRNSFVYIFKSTQLGLLALITSTVFLRTRMRVDTLHSNYYLGSLFFALLLQMVNGFPELAMTVTRLPIFYKQRDLFFYPAWAYSISASLLKIPVSLLESVVWTTITYYLIGFTPEASRYFRHLLLLFFVHAMSMSMFRFAASYFQTAVASTLGGTLLLVFCLIFGGFILPRPSIPQWLKWGFWVSPLTYAEIGIAVNEFLAPRWQKMQSSNVTTGTQMLISRGLNYVGSYYWIGVGALIGFILLFNFGFTLALTFKRPYGASKGIISREKLHQLQGHKTLDSSTTSPQEHKKAGKMVLPFTPLTVSFQDLNYYVDVPPEMREQGYAEKRLQLLHNITGAFQPGVLSALMGVTGAGKTTLLDVLSGRKTGGYIEGEIRIGGYPKVQETFARISGYCEQTDIHSPQITVEESVAYSAWLRLPAEINAKTRHDFVNEVIETIELDPIRDALVGLPGLNGLSTEQRKRLTIAVELVSNPSVIFMDEPTSGLDARAAAIVMRAVKNVAQTGRTVVCTIHQPSTDIFEAFDKLILMKRGGELIYSGHLGRHSCKVIEYFEGNSGVPKIRDNYNPATWMLEVTSTSVEAHMGINFAHIYKESDLNKENEIMVKELSMPPPGSSDLRFKTRYAQKFWVQFKACLWKQSLSYWRSPHYNMARILFMFLSSVMLGLLFWKHGGKINNEQDLFNILGCMYCATMLNGITNCSSTIPFVAVERTVVYRENFAGMYSPWVYSFAQVAIEIPYVLFQVVMFMIIAYPAIGFEWNAGKFMWFFYIMFCMLLYMIYLGMMLTVITPNVQLATILTSVFYQLLILFSGFIVPQPQIPGWWIWMYYICPLAWTLKALLTSQYGDVSKVIVVFGEEKSILQFLEDYFGFYHDRLPLVAVLLVMYPIVFAILFGYFIGRINFQKR